MRREGRGRGGGQREIKSLMERERRQREVCEKDNEGEREEKKLFERHERQAWIHRAETTHFL